MPRGSTMSLSFPPFTRAVKLLLIANAAVFLFIALVHAFTSPLITRWIELHLGLVPLLVVHGYIWQLVTYSFLHEGVLHLLFNMLALWMFGAQLETEWGYNLFLQFYFFCVVGAALCTIAISFTYILGVDPRIPTVGASGGVYGILVAFGILHGNSEVMLFPLPFQIKAKYFVIGIIFLDLYGALAYAQGGQNIAYMAHLGGALFGYLFLKFVPRRGFGYVASERAYGLRNSYYRWKRRRAARKFEVYMRKHDSRGDYKHEDYFDELGNFKDPSTREPGKKNGESRSGWVN